MSPHRTDLEEANGTTDAGSRPVRPVAMSGATGTAAGPTGSPAPGRATPPRPRQPPRHRSRPQSRPWPWRHRRSLPFRPSSRRRLRPRLRRPPPLPLRCRYGRGAQSWDSSPCSQANRSRTTPTVPSSSTLIPAARVCSTATRRLRPRRHRGLRGVWRRGGLVPALALGHDRRDTVLAHGFRGEPRLVVHHCRARPRVRLAAVVRLRPLRWVAMGMALVLAGLTFRDLVHFHDVVVTMNAVLGERGRPRHRHVDHGRLRDRGARRLVPTG